MQTRKHGFFISTFKFFPTIFQNGCFNLSEKNEKSVEMNLFFNIIYILLQSISSKKV